VVRRKDKKQDEQERMTAAMRRLEELLQDPGRGITVTPVTESPIRANPHIADGTIPAVPEATETGIASPSPSTAAPDPAATAPPAAVTAPEAGAPSPQSSPAPAWAAKIAGGPEKPPPRAAKAETAAQAKQARVPGLKGFSPSQSSAGLFGIFLNWLLGPRDSEIKDAVAMSRRALNATFLFSAVINILMMAGPLFMLQVYDRVLSSGSFPTLVALALITGALYAIIGLLELSRSRIISRVGAEIDQRLSDRVFEASLRKSLATQGAAGQALRELDSFRQFISGPAPLTFFDTPWTPVYLAVIFMTHWTLGIAATIGTCILLFLAWLSEQRGRQPLTEASRTVAKSLEMAETGQRNAEAITAMGMLGAYRSRWQQLNGEGLGWQLLAADRLGGMSAITKTTRLMMQSLMLAIAAALAMTGAISSGSIIAATIIFGRALAPVEQIIGHWRGFIKARESYFKLEDILSYAPSERSRTQLPRPRGVLECANVRVAAPETRNVILNGISFAAQPGQMLAIIGPSASGKSTLVRAIVGLWPAFGGAVLLDGARLDQWHPEDLGRYIGYLPQSVELFAGTVKQNIARFNGNASDEEIIEAAKQAHAHELILSLPHGYETELGAFGTYLSGGQRQRIALARALFGTPPLVVLDEPNSNLDRPGDEALSSAIDGCRKRGQTVILVSHRVQAIGKADLLLFLEKGQQRAFGPRNEVMKLFQGPAQQQPQQQRVSPKSSPVEERRAGRPDAEPGTGEAQQETVIAESEQRPTGSEG
jgi:PrtD family type I secretion system ABC transporter